MAGIFGDGQRGGIFGAKVDPRLVAELERRAGEKRRMAQGLESAGKEPSTIGSRALDWWNSTNLARMADPRTSPFGPAAVARLFMDPAGEVGRQVETGEQLAKPFTQFGDPNVSPVKQGADLAMTVMGGSSVVPAAANELRMGIKAYHASPHSFERFDASKIGTGQGAQSFGHGIYVAENPRVSGRGGQYDREFTAKKLGQSDTTPQQEYILNQLDSGASDLDILKGLAQRGGTDFEQAQGMLDSVKANRAKIYEVDIAAEPEQFLDWDKPLSEQSPQVKAAIEALPNAETFKGAAGTLRSGLPGEAVYRNAAKEVYAIRGAKDQRWEPTGKTFEESLAMVGGDHSRVLRMRGGTKEEAAEALREAGIPGIRYLDQGSRGAGTGTSNYVVFPGNEHLIAILKKYGLPISAAGLAALSQLHPQEAQAAQKGKR